MAYMKLIIYGIGIAILCFVMFYIGYKMKLRREFDHKLNDRVNDALSKYYMTEKFTSEYEGSKMSRCESEEEA